MLRLMNTLRERVNFKTLVLGAAMANPFAITNPNIVQKDAFTVIEAEKYDAMGGVSTTDNAVTDLSEVSYVQYSQVNFGTGANSVSMKVAGASAGGSVEIHLDSLTGPVIGSVSVPPTSGAFVSRSADIKTTTGLHELFMVGRGTSSSASIDNFVFSPNPVPPQAIQTSAPPLLVSSPARPSSGSTASCPGPVGQDSSQYHLVFRDEFEGNSLNKNVWNTQVWYLPSEPGPKNYAVENGSLKIWPDDGFYNRTLDTDGKYTQTYGYFEISAKLPIGLGTWPAFWLYAHPGNERPEIDVMEAYAGGGPNTGWGDENLHPTNFGVTLHKANADYTIDEKPMEFKSAQYIGYVDLSAKPHVYAVKWEPELLSFYFDGKKIGEEYRDTSNYYNRPMYLMLDLWFGSSSGQPQDGITPKGKNNSYEVEYIRAWQFGPGSCAK